MALIRRGPNRFASWNTEKLLTDRWRTGRAWCLCHQPPLLAFRIQLRDLPFVQARGKLDKRVGTTICGVELTRREFVRGAVRELLEELSVLRA